MIPSRHPSGRAAGTWWTAIALVLLMGLAGCASPGGPKPGRTRLESRLIEIPVELVGNLLVVELSWDRHGPWRFLIDTGSSVTLVDPAFADRYRLDARTTRLPRVRVRGAAGEYAELEPVTLSRIEMGDARFERVQALVYDCAELSAHLGRPIHGIIGFPLFRHTTLTIDYPRSRLILTRALHPPLLPGSRIPFEAAGPLPLISIEVAGQNLLALIDTGSDGPLNLNPVGLDLSYLVPPRPGATVATLAGERVQEVGRLEGRLRLGDYPIVEPIVDLTDELSSLGGEVLRHFTLTFDQQRRNVIIHRDTPAPLGMPPRRSSGLSFSRTPAYWRVVGVIPGSPAEARGMRPGYLVARINEEPVARWNLERFRREVQRAPSITVALIEGNAERVIELETYLLVP
jgi:hypothetical protein